MAIVRRYRTHNLERVICSGWCALITLGRRGYKSWPSQQCRSVWILLTSSVLQLYKQLHSFGHNESFRMLPSWCITQQQAVPALAATQSSFTFELHHFWWNVWGSFNHIQSRVRLEWPHQLCFYCPNWIKLCMFLDNIWCWLMLLTD